MTSIMDIEVLTAIVAACASDENNAAQRAALAGEELAKAETKVAELEVSAKTDPMARTALIHARQELAGYRELYGEQQREHEATVQALNDAAAHLQFIQWATDPALMTDGDIAAAVAETRAAIQPLLFALAEKVHASGEARRRLEEDLNGGPVYAGQYPNTERHGVTLTHNREIIVNHPEGVRVYGSRSTGVALGDATKNFDDEWRAAQRG